MHELVFDFLLRESTVHLGGCLVMVAESLLAPVLLPILLEVNEAALQDMQLLRVYLGGLLFALLLLDEARSLQEVVLNPELDNVHNSRDDDDNDEDLQVWVRVESGQQGDGDVNQC